MVEHGEDCAVGTRGVSLRNRILNRETESGLAWDRGEVDSLVSGPNNASVAQPEIVRRIKTYSAENGSVYQYQFHEIGEETREGEPCAAYIYYATSDRKQMRAVRVVVMRSAVQKWSAANARTLTGTEEYAVAKMRLFEGFDEDDDLLIAARDLIVDEKNIAELLEKLNL